MDPGHATVIRTAQESDVPVLHAILSIPSVSQGFFGMSVSDDFVQCTLRDSLDQVSMGRGEAWVVASGMTPIAYAAVVQGALSFFVHPDHWRNNHASVLLGLICRRGIASAPLACIQAFVFRSNTPSIRTLEQLGFRFAGLTSRFIGTQPLPLAVLSYSLSAAQVRVHPAFSVDTIKA